MIAFLNSFYSLWSDGGPLMWPLLLISIFIYWNIFELFSRFSQIELEQQKEFLASGTDKNIDITSVRVQMDIIKKEHLPYFKSKIKFLSVLAGISPLLGLLGTVMGMLRTFSLMSSGDIQKADLMAGGISEALITTQMGLIIAVPALLMISALRIKKDRLNTFFEKIEIEGLRQAFDNGGAK